MRNKKFLTTNPIAHRGVHNQYLENSLMAFQECIKRKYPIELDVQLTKDQEVVVFHDLTLQRIFGIGRSIHDLTLKEIKKYHYIPTIKEVFHLVEGKVPILIEIKFDKRFYVLEKKLVKILKNYSGPIAIMSFNPLSILFFRLNAPSYIRGFLINSIIPQNFLMKILFQSKIIKKCLKPDFIAADLPLLKNKNIQKLRKKYLLLGYTIKSEQEYQSLKEYADNFIWDILK